MPTITGTRSIGQDGGRYSSDTALIPELAEGAAQKDEAKKKQLADKYTKELNTKKEAINKTYTEKLQAIDKNVSELIAKKAKAGGFNVVLAKGVVLYGGTDITASIAKEVK